MKYTDDLKYLAVYEDLNDHLTVFDLENMTEHSNVSDIGRVFQFSVSQSGDEIYFYDLDDGIFYAKNTNDGSINWTHTPIDVSPNIFIPAVNSDNSVFAASWNYSYEFQADSGAFRILSNRGVSDYYSLEFYIFGSVGNNRKIAVSEASVFCLAGYCFVVGDLTVRLVDFNTGLDRQIYKAENSGSGTTVKGRFIGELLYETPIVSAFSGKLMFFLYILIIWTAAYFYKNYRLKV